MPDPDPQPPQPRPISAARWLLMLLPSVPMLFTPSHIEPVGGGRVSEAQISHLLGRGLLTLAFVTALCGALGFLLEKWRHGSVENTAQAVAYGIAIFVVNCFVAFAGCAAFPLTSHR